MGTRGQSRRQGVGCGGNKGGDTRVGSEGEDRLPRGLGGQHGGGCGWAWDQ